MNWRVRFVAILILLLFAGFSFYYLRLYVVPKKHAVILFVLPRLMPGEVLAASNLQTLNSANQTAFVQISPDDDYASAMTQLASGRPGTPGQLGLDAEGNRLDSLLYKAQRKGRHVGIVSTIGLTSPGVAAFFSHEKDALAKEKIALQVMDSTKINLIFAKNDGLFERVKENTSRDLIQEAKKGGFQLIRTREKLENAPLWLPKNLMGIFSSENPVEPPSLDDFTRRAIQKLQYHIGGYFLVIEHGLSVADSIKSKQQEVLKLDRAIATALAYAGKNTLLLVYFPNSEASWAFLYGNGSLQSISTPADLHQLIAKEL